MLESSAVFFKHSGEMLAALLVSVGPYPSFLTTVNQFVVRKVVLLFRHFQPVRLLVVTWNTTVGCLWFCNSFERLTTWIRWVSTAVHSGSLSLLYALTCNCQMFLASLSNIIEYILCWQHFLSCHPEDLQLEAADDMGFWCARVLFLSIGSTIEEVKQ
jgi:hypothetical protein